MGSVSTAEFFGGSTNVTLSGDFLDITPRYRFWRITNSGATTRQITFPPTATLGLQAGGPIFIIANIGPNAFNYRDFENALPLLSLASGKAIIVSAYYLGTSLVTSCMLQWAPHSTAFNYSSH